MAIINEFTNNSRNQPQYFGCLKDISSESKVTLVDGTMQLFNYLTGNYYLNTQTSSASEISTKFEDYYTQTKVNELTTTLNNKFNSYYTQTKVNELTTTLNNKFNSYYTKDEVNSLLNNLKTELMGIIDSKHPTT